MISHKPSEPKKKTLEDEIKVAVRNEIEFNAHSGSIVKAVLEKDSYKTELFRLTKV